MRAKVSVTVYNYGAALSMSAGPQLKIYASANTIHTNLETNFVQLGESKAIPALAAGGSKTFEWEVDIMGERGLYPLTVGIKDVDEVNTRNNQTTKWFESNL